ncbi:MAG: hypothetical protein JWL71_2259 [Acidobacteria bacterium]|nr:hypothetical protein [Acidobacteriota bacterium]
MQGGGRFQHLFDNAPDLIYRYGILPSRVIHYINPACRDITGRSAEEFYANPQLAFTCVHPDDRHLLSDVFQDDPAKLRLAIMLRWIHPDGRIVWAEHRRMPIFDRQGRLIAIEGIGRDVTDRIEAEHRLAERESRFRLLAENAADMIYRYRVFPDPQTEYVSPAAAAITGYTAEQMMSEPTMGLRIVHPDDRQLAVAMIEDAERFQAPTVLRYVRPDGRVVSVEHRNTPIFDDTGRVVAIEGIGRDVTESLAIHDRLRVSETRLRRLAASLHSARESERANVARELHDELGQALTSLKIDLTRTLRDLIPLHLAPEMVDRMQSMVGGIEVATETVRRLATALRPPALDHLGLAAAIELEGAALARRTGLRCRISGNLRAAGLTNEETTAVFRIVQEALTNIVRHADASVVRIVMRETQRHMSVTVQDNGRGITATAIDDAASIGLLGMRERAELIGARLEISGQAGKGTVVVITLPNPDGRGRP